jgi:putative transposase
VLDVCHWPRFVDLPPAQVYATLLDEGTYLCSTRTMYRILEEAGEVRERRDQRTHPTYAMPILEATQPNQVWTWDITKLRGPERWIWYELYVMLDLFSRYVVGWLLAEWEDENLACALIEECVRRQGIKPGQLQTHSDRGSSMIAKTVGDVLTKLGVERSFSRPRVSNDNPYSESQFKTLKYRPTFPDRFGSIQHARQVIGPLMSWYNEEHLHSGLGFVTPADVHYGRAPRIIEARRSVLAGAYAAHPERFPNGQPQPAPLPTSVWINRPDEASRGDLALHTTHDLEVSQSC